LTSNFDLPRALRRIRPQRAAQRLQRRAVSDLPFLEAVTLAGPELLLDTCVYIDVLQGRAPSKMEALIQTRIINHSTVCLSELTHLFGRLDPAHPGTKGILKEIQQTIDDTPGHRLSAPSTMAFGEAGMLAGLVARLTGTDRKMPLMNDACLYLQALERGWIVLTRNVRDFDYFDQFLPAGRVLFYEAASGSGT
jgi:predicted nucleic acid-binding protein